MVLPTVTRNNFTKGTTSVDIISKVYVYCELLLGVNRFPLLNEERILVTLFYVYSLLLNAYVCYGAINSSFDDSVWISKISLKASRVIQYEVTAVLSLFIWKRFHRFYKEIENFDNVVRCRPKFANRSIILLLSFGILVVLTFFLLPNYRIESLPLHLITTCESIFFGHLIDLIMTRMRLLNYYLERSTSIPKTDSSPKITEFWFFDIDSQRFYFPNMDKMMDFYQIIINAHKFLVDAVKWQVSCILMY